MSRMKAVLAAGAITSVVLLAIAAVTLINWIAEGRIVFNSPATETAQAGEAYLEELEVRQEALGEAVVVMEGREGEYAAQLAAAEQHIHELRRAISDQRAQNEADEMQMADLEGQVQAVNGVVYQLEGEASVWQNKEAGYAAQIEAANVRIIQLQAQIQQMAGQ